MTKRAKAVWKAHNGGILGLSTWGDDSCAAMSHIIAAVVGKSSDAAAEPGSSTSHQPGVSPPLSPINMRDEEIELTAPKAVVPRPPSMTSDKIGLAPMGGPRPESPTDVFAAAGWSDAARIPSAGYAGITPGSEEGDP